MKRTNNLTKFSVTQCHGLKKLNAIIDRNDNFFHKKIMS